MNETLKEEVEPIKEFVGEITDLLQGRKITSIQDSEDQQAVIEITKKYYPDPPSFEFCASMYLTAYIASALVNREVMAHVREEVNYELTSRRIPFRLKQKSTTQ